MGSGYEALQPPPLTPDGALQGRLSNLASAAGMIGRRAIGWDYLVEDTPVTLPPNTVNWTTLTPGAQITFTIDRAPAYVAVYSRFTQVTAGGGVSAVVMCDHQPFSDNGAGGIPGWYGFGSTFGPGLVLPNPGANTVFQTGGSGSAPLPNGGITISFFDGPTGGVPAVVTMRMYFANSHGSLSRQIRDRRLYATVL